jgi:Cu-Zn family superoxide dismutase
MTKVLGMGWIAGLLLAGGCAATGTNNSNAPAEDNNAMSSRHADHAVQAADNAKQSAMNHDSSLKEAIAVIHPTPGNKVHGTVKFIAQDNGKVRVVADLQGLKPMSKHGFHVHQYGDCSAPDATSAGGHYNPENHKHAGPSTEMRHAGDLGNIESDGKGNAHLDMTVDNISIDGKDAVLGRAVIVHAKADDLKTQPTGDAGARIGCGVIGVANSKDAG